MACERFRSFTFKGSTRIMIERANQIIEEIRAQGYTLTLRQLFYQLVSRDVIANKQSEYKRIGDILSNARLAGLVDWNAIEDRTRYLQGVSHWGEPGDIIQSSADSFRIDKWHDQGNRIEVWVEKDALVGIVAQACRKLDVDWFSCRGYTSQTALYNAGKRISNHIYRDRKTPIIIHLGDHDPSGIHMTQDIYDRLFMFVGCEVEVKRIALNMNQVDEFHPPPNPAKETDSRFQKYADEFGEECWELDALDPGIIDGLITDTVKSYRDDALYAANEDLEAKQRELLAKSADRWPEIAELMEREAGSYRIAPLKKRKPKKRK